MAERAYQRKRSRRRRCAVNQNSAEMVHDSRMLSGSITSRIAEQARKIGFDLCGVARAEECGDPERLAEWLARGYAGEMHYLSDARRLAAHDAMPGVCSVIVCAMNYNTASPYSQAALGNAAKNTDVNGGAKDEHSAPRGWISRYAWGEEYHDVLKAKLEELLSWLRGEIDGEFQARTYVDTGPVLERLAAKHAGLGWVAKNTCLINQKLGSWLFLGVILTDLDLAPSLSDGDASSRNLCGTCTRCIDACPTDAFIEPYVMDARRCIAYLTIELRGSIPEELRPAMGSMVFGCDICQDVCPWNRKAPATTLTQFLPREIVNESGDTTKSSTHANGRASLFLPELDWLVTLSEDEFRRVFRGSPVKRTKWRGMLRNACVALGNSRIQLENPAYSRIVQRLEELAVGADAMIAEHAAWALKQIREANSPSNEMHLNANTEEQ
jgi:epoxyqueuosine reductase